MKPFALFKHRTMPVMAFCLLAVAPILAAGSIEGSTPDGATFSAPDQWELGQPLVVEGKGWKTAAGNQGSVIAVKYDQGTVVPADPVDDLDGVWLVITADRDGNWVAELPFPENAGWADGETHAVHLLTGMLVNDDNIRNPTIRVTTVEKP